MSDKDDILLQLGGARGEYKNTVARIDEDLRVERMRRLAVARAGIEQLVVQAYIAGASINAIKMAYGTKDFNTVKRILDANAEAIAKATAPEVEVETTTVRGWINVENLDGDLELTLTNDDGQTARFAVIDMDEDGFMLDGFTSGADAMDLIREWDGEIVNYRSTDEGGEIYRAIIERIDSHD